MHRFLNSGIFPWSHSPHTNRQGKGPFAISVLSDTDRFRAERRFDFPDKSRGCVYINFRRLVMVNISISKPSILFYFKGGRDEQEKK